MHIFEMGSGDTCKKTGFPPSKTELALLNDLNKPLGIRFRLEERIRMVVQLEQEGVDTISVLRENAIQVRLFQRDFNSMAEMAFDRVGQKVILLNGQREMFFRVVDREAK